MLSLRSVPSLHSFCSLLLFLAIIYRSLRSLSFSPPLVPFRSFHSLQVTPSIESRSFASLRFFSFYLPKSYVYRRFQPNQSIQSLRSFLSFFVFHLPTITI